MWRSVIVFACLLGFSSALTFVGDYPASVTGGADGMQPNCLDPTNPATCFPPILPFVPTNTYEWQNQMGASDPFIFNKNYTVVYAEDQYGCTLTPNPPYYQGNVMAAYFAVGSVTCGFPEISAAARSVGAVAVILIAPIPQSVAMVNYGYSTPTGYPPILTWANLGEDQPFKNQLPMSISMLGGILALGNVTVHLDYPARNPLFLQFMTIPSGLSFFTWFTWALVLVALTVVCMKLGMFMLSRLHRTLGFYCLLFCYVGAIFSTLASFSAFLQIGLGNAANIQIYGVWEYWNWTCAQSAAILIGLYFSEIAMLTSAQKVPGLDKMKIPAYILLGLLWLTLLIVCLLDTFYRPGSPETNFTGAIRIPAVVVFSIAAGLALGVIVYGSIMLLRAMGSNIKTVLPFIIVALWIGITNAWGTGLWLAIRWFTPEILINYGNWTEADIVMLFRFALLWPTSIIFISIAMIFRVQVEKEIEVSRSGTSSTSGTGASKSSASTSSSSQKEQVIEL